jgi:hypothetical protein
MNGTANGDADGVDIQFPDERTVNYVFPVEVIVVGTLTEDDRREIYQRVWNDFGDALEYQNA